MIKIKHFIMSAVITVIVAACVEEEDYAIASVSMGDFQLINSSEGQITATYSMEVGHTWYDDIDLFIAWAKDPKDLEPTISDEGWVWWENVIDYTYEDISFQKSTSGKFTAKIPLNKLTPSMTYYARACIVYYFVGEQFQRYSDIKSFTIAAESLEPVDLGLSVDWSTCNLGATAPKEEGGRYTWGDPEKGEQSNWNINWRNYKWANGYENTLTKYCNNDQYGRVDNLYILEKEDDAAYVQTEGIWRIPTPSEWEELMKKCSWHYDISIDGFIVSKNGESIVLPAGGYWTNELFTEWGGIKAPTAISARIFENSITTGKSSRSSKCLIRAVRDK